ncbi:thioredoxin family protein [Archaeoglobus veneficus]|uniref:Thioredoxin domain-containing protein n=1 Tax=Archaeoglobus veneficus (strain DSM 11195 / SNP6) TaxID=693661 RepID=F2KQ10_ARCVS|nr:thioredoxin family protein [Archaeoglobus veneficus]AEA47613.1 hypothetical protein Arcve_1613 [Archaeoglobus veneficus SNP6]
MRRLLPVLGTILIFSSLIIGCTQNQVEMKTETGAKITETENLNENETVKVFFYYSPRCPSCVKIKPYMNLLREEVQGIKFDFCDVSNKSLCSNESLWVAKHIGLFGVPTAVFIQGDRVAVFVGWKKVAKLGVYLEELGFEVPEVVYGNTSYDVQECIDCHEGRGINPPSTYSCTYCCHMAQIQQAQNQTQNVTQGS